MNDPDASLQCKFRKYSCITHLNWTSALEAWILEYGNKNGRMPISLPAKPNYVISKVFGFHLNTTPTWATANLGEKRAQVPLRCYTITYKLHVANMHLFLTIMYLRIDLLLPSIQSIERANHATLCHNIYRSCFNIKSGFCTHPTNVVQYTAEWNLSTWSLHRYSKHKLRVTPPNIKSYSELVPSPQRSLSTLLLP